MTTPDGIREFRYRAATRSGEVVRGRVRALDASDAATQVDRMGLLLITTTEVDVPRSRRVRTSDLAVAFRNVATLVESGVPIERALGVTEPLVPRNLAGPLSDVRRRIREGRSVAEALEAHGDVFPRSVIGTVRAGERGSELARACEHVAQSLESEANLRAQIRSALAYPMLILAVGLATVAVLGGVVVPRFALVLSDFGADLPPATRALVTGSMVLRRYGLALAAGTVAITALLRRALSSPTLRPRLDRALLRAPVVGRIRLLFASARASRSLGAMLLNGMPLLSALEAAGGAAGDLEVARRIAAAKDLVARGTALTTALESERALSPLTIQLVGVGEAGGCLGPMLMRGGALAAEQGERSLRTAVALLEPALILALGVLVAFVAGALLQAVYSVRPG